MYLLRNMHKLKKIPKEFDTPEFRRLFILAEIGKFTAEEMKQYLNSLKQMSDYYNIIESTAELAEKRGREEGENKVRREDAIKFKALGVSIDIIAQATGLPIDIIEGL